MNKFLKGSAAKSAASRGVSAKSVDLDVRPTIRAIFTENGNAPIKFSDLVEIVASKNSEIDASIINAKMTSVKRDLSFLEKAEGHGMYRIAGGVVTAP